MTLLCFVAPVLEKLRIDHRIPLGGRFSRNPFLLQTRHITGVEYWIRNVVRQPDFEHLGPLLFHIRKERALWAVFRE